MVGKVKEHESNYVPGILFYNSHHQMLQLHEQLLTSQLWIELRIFHQWIPGQVQRDATGWYLQTLSHSGIRLHAGLTARFCLVW